jgi:hypothetical protein
MRVITSGWHAPYFGTWLYSEFYRQHSRWRKLSRYELRRLRRSIRLYCRSSVAQDSWCTRQNLQTHTLTCKYHTVSRYTRKSNLIYTCKKSTAFHTPTFMKLVNAQSSYTEFHPNWIINMESGGRNSFTPLRIVWFSQIFTKLVVT